jgi:hypothetical protein
MTVKNIYLGLVSDQMLQDAGSEGFFLFADSYWCFKLEVSLEDGFLRMFDSVGRMVPIDKDQYLELASALDAVSVEQQTYDTLGNLATNARQEQQNLLDELPDFGIDGEDTILED